MRDMTVQKTTLSSLFLTLRRGRTGNIIVLFVFVQVAAILLAILFPNYFRYLDVSNIQLMLKAIPSLVIITLGVNLLMIAGEFDLSVGAIFTFTALIMAKLFNAHVPLGLAVAAALLVGAGIGLLNGFIVVKTNVPSFIVTLGAMWFWRGIILIVSQAVTESFYPSRFFEQLFTLNVGPIQIQFVWALLIAIICWFLLERHRLGNFFFGVGGNRKAAFALGVNVGLVKIDRVRHHGVPHRLRGHHEHGAHQLDLAHPGGGAGAAGDRRLRHRRDRPGMGGQGTMLGAFLGAALMFTIQDILLLLQAPGFYLRMFVGIVIVIAAALNELLKKE